MKENDLTLKEPQNLLFEHGIEVSHSAVDNALRSMGITRKKKTTVATERDRPNVRKKRERWFNETLAAWMS